MSKIDTSILVNAIQRSEVTLHDGRVVQIRAFVMKEMKLLMMAHESGTGHEQALVQVLKSCILSELDVETLPLFDVEHLYLQLYKLSKGNSIIPVTFRCVNDVPANIPTDENEVIDQSITKKCNTEIKSNANLNQVKMSEAPDSIVKITDQLTIEMRYPNVLEQEFFDMKKESDIFNLINRCVSKIYMGPTVHIVGDDISYDEVAEVMQFVDDAGFEKLTAFINEIPQVELTIPLVCPNCGHAEPVVLTGISDFFD